MKRIIQYAAIVIALSLAASCSNLIEEKTLEGGLISFEPQSLETKARVTPDNLTGEEFAVWDLMGSDIHIQNSIKYSGGNWAYQDPANATYYWKDGTHKFFGYSYNEGSFANNVWSIGSTASPVTITTAAADQTDYLYSSIETTTAAEWKATTGHTKDTPVKLTFHHLLSAIRVTMINASGENVTVSSAAVTLPNTGSATVSFAGDQAARSVTVGATPGSFGGFTAQKSLAAGDSLNVLDGTVLTTANTLAAPYMIWPQTIVEKTAESTDNTATIAVTLKVGSAAEETVPIPIPATTWAAGEINSYRLLIYPNDIKLVFEVQPWEVVEIPAMDTSNGSINMSNVSWMNTKVRTSATGAEINTVDNGGKSVTMYYKPYRNTSTDPENPSWTQYDGYYPAQGFFTVNYPLEGKFKIGLIPAYGQTESDLHADMYEILIYKNGTFQAISDTGEDLAGWREYTTGANPVLKGANTIYFQVRASSTVAASHPEYKAQIDIWFQPEGSTEWISAYSEIRATYSLVIPARQ